MKEEVTAPRQHAIGSGLRNATAAKDRPSLCNCSRVLNLTICAILLKTETSLRNRLPIVTLYSETAKDGEGDGGV